MDSDSNKRSRHEFNEAKKKFKSLCEPITTAAFSVISDWSCSTEAAIPCDDDGVSNQVYHHHTADQDDNSSSDLEGNDETFPDSDDDRKDDVQNKAFQPRDWMEWFNDLLDFCQIHGNCNAPSTYEIPGNRRKLGSWLTNQRRNRKKGILRADREALMQALVDDGKLWWDVDRTSSDHRDWDGWFQDLVDYGDANGTCNVPVVTVTPEGRKLGQWLNNQKGLQRSGRLKPDRELRMQTLVEKGLFSW